MQQFHGRTLSGGYSTLVDSKNTQSRLWNNAGAIWCLALIPLAIAAAISFVSIAKGRGPGNLVDFLGAAREMLRGGDI